MAFPLENTNSSSGSMKNRHTSMFRFSDALTYLITHSITQLGMVVGKKYHTLKGEESISNIWVFSIITDITYASIIGYNNQKEAIHT